MEHGLERCFTYINCQLQPAGKAGPYAQHELRHRVVTISRQTGSGSHIVAERLAAILQPRQPENACPWTVFDHNLLEKVLQDHHLPSRLARYMPEDRVSHISDTMDELFGLHPPSETLVRKTSDTILHLAELGNVIIIGRGATVLTRRMPHVFHVRLIGSVEKRVAHIMDYYKLGQKEAVEMLHREDRGRERYLKKYFKADINDPLLYHLVINTDLMSYAAAAELIAEAVAPLATASKPMPA